MGIQVKAFKIGKSIRVGSGGSKIVFSVFAVTDAVEKLLS
jgi:hypothetical protein